MAVHYTQPPPQAAQDIQRTETHLTHAIAPYPNFMLHNFTAVFNSIGRL